jgi:hypothetical protein
LQVKILNIYGREKRSDKKRVVERNETHDVPHQSFTIFDIIKQELLRYKFVIDFVGFEVFTPVVMKSIVLLQTCIGLLAKMPGVAQDSIRNEGTREINYGIIQK